MNIYERQTVDVRFYRQRQELIKQQFKGEMTV